MEAYYDVVIVGAGPAGLSAAEIFKNSHLKVLILEKNKEVGPKVCAAGITRKTLELMDIPENLFEKKISKTFIRTTKYVHNGVLNEPVVFMIDRKKFGQWQLSKVATANNITIELSARVTKIEPGVVEINRNKSVQYHYLIGADGVNSLVRRFLRIPVKKRLVSLQYKVPAKYLDNSEAIEIILKSKYFHSGYAWIFPHRNHSDVGCLVNPKVWSIKKLRKGFNNWLEEKGIDISNSKYESFPINYDYRGYIFGNVYLVGEAAGLASGLTGEGIYQALVSGSEIAKLILNENYKPEQLRQVLKYNKFQNRILHYLNLLGPTRDRFYNIFMKQILNKRLNKKIINKLS
jgi:geranylgeranyl reductase